MSTAFTTYLCPVLGPGAIDPPSSSQEETHITNTKKRPYSLCKDLTRQRVVPFTTGLVKRPISLNNFDTYCLSNTLTSSVTLVDVFTPVIFTRVPSTFSN